MMSTLKRHGGTAGLVVAIVALIAALAGGAIAANGGGEATTAAKKKSKGKPGPRGPRGFTGATGPQGPASANGKDGASGASGSNGVPGVPGEDGKDGVSVFSEEFLGAKGPCTAGGSEFEAAEEAATYACNGKKGDIGDKGDKGSPWTLGGVLPPGATETGTWTLSSDSPLFSGAFYMTPISFPVSLNEPVVPGKAHYVSNAKVENAEVPAECNDEVAPSPSAKHPEADPGSFCVFGSIIELETPTVTIQDFEFASETTETSGALLVSEDLNFFVTGSFAVTGAP